MPATAETYFLFSLAVDVSLCFMLSLVWFRQRSEWQALFWAVSQLSLSSTALLWFAVPDHPLKPPIAALALTIAVTALWAGTAYFLGGLRRSAWRPATLVAGAIWLVLTLCWLAWPSSIEQSTAAALGVAMGWAGFQLVRQGSVYRLLGCLLLIRGLFNLSTALGWLALDFTAWLLFLVAVKTLTLLGVLSAVQEKIRRRYAHKLDSLASALLVVDRDARVVEASQRCAAKLGYATPAALHGQLLSDLIDGPLPALVQDWLDRPREPAGVLAPVETVLIRKDGSELPLDVIAARFDEGGLRFFSLQLIDVSERKKKDAQLFHQARHDSLTGALNRFGLLQAIEKAPVAHYAVLFIDLDRFQRINDCFGHAVGDQLLRQVGEVLRGQLGPQDCLARLNGDKFVIVLRPPAGSVIGDLASACGALVLAALRAGLVIDFQTVTVSASIGLACCPQHGEDAATLINTAETAMYEVKKSGRGMLRVFDPAMNASARDALAIDAALRRAIREGELHVLYQPIVDTTSGELKKVEALLRWTSPTLGIVSPDRFIPVAEETDLIIELGAWVLDEACRQLRAGNGAAGDIAVSVNVSPRQLADPGFIDLVERVLARYALAAPQLELELTERVLIDGRVNAQAVLGRLSAMGVRISLDDFGTGYSSLSYLTRFRIDTLKIDRSFVMDIERNARSRSLVSTIVGMGHSLGLEVVAEGVETAAQAAALGGMGCHCLQGYLIARPIAPDQLLRLVAERAAAC
ncbi:putative bifunctional diguanylate cyclase/phosphodiesterase [Massilia sp. DWR3-1-1]|uniref:putative bifunctional diguanylate cyclase/phosphodiesterase n=1 Tax=Massilia sp. DWR3-1-1 TaxID=2804559 RepID=UPI003CFB5EC4